MKKNSIYAGMLLLGMAVATGCSNEESLEQVMNNGKTFKAVIENVEARTSVNDAYQVLWTEGDQFDVWDSETKAGVLELRNGNGTTSGTFGLPTDATSFDVEEGMTAFFPASSGDSKSYTFAESYTSQETDAPMSGTFTEGKFTFSLLTAMVRVVVADVPAGNVEMTISSNDLTLTGVATLSNGALTVPTEGQKSVSVKFKTTEAGTLTFDVPVPVQNYINGLSVVVKSGDTEVLNKTTNGFEAAAGKLYLFGATYVTAENAETTLQSALNGWEEGDVVVLTGEEETITVSSLTLDQDITATLDLNGKTLNLTGSSVRSAAEYGLTNNGELTITNGTITSSEDFIAAIFNNGTLTVTGSTINASNRGIINNGTATLDCNITSENSNAVCGYGPNNEITINGGTYTASTTTANASALRMDPRTGGVPTGSQVDSAWKLTINGGTFVSEGWIALEMLNNYYNLSEEGWAKINAGTFTGSADHADIGGTTIRNITISSECVLTNKIIKEQTNGTITYDCVMNGYNLQDKDNHYDNVFIAAVFANGGSYTLENDVTVAESLEVAADKEVTLNLGSKTLTSTDDYAAFINNGTLTLNSDTEGGIKASYRGIINNGTATLDCNITSENSNAVCGYGPNNVITITGGTYTASKTTAKASALRMDPRTGGTTTGSQVDSAWKLTIEGGTFVSENWVALEMLNNYYGLGENAGWAKISGGTFTGSADHADIGGVAVENITIASSCTLTNQIIKNQTDGTISYNCVMNDYNLQDSNNHYSDVFKTNNN